MAELEGIIPALESAHAVAYVLRGPTAAGDGAADATTPDASAPDAAPFDLSATRFHAGELIIVNLSGRGDKDVHEVARLLEMAP